MTPSVAEIQSAVADHYGITVEQILSPRRNASIVWPRHVAMWLAREMTGLSFPALARQFNRDHSTIIYAGQRVIRRIQNDESAARDIDLLRQRLESP
jgi:chromosomal replication initiator protein